MKKRLNRYRKHAKQGKLDKSIEADDALGVPKSWREKNPPGNGSADSTQSDSAKKIPTGSDGMISELMDQLVAGAGSIHERMEFFQRVAKTIHAFLIEHGSMLGYLSFHDIVRNEMLGAFNPHFKDCGCEGCKKDVYLIKRQINNTNDVGIVLEDLDMEQVARDFDNDHSS